MRYDPVETLMQSEDAAIGLLAGHELLGLPVKEKVMTKLPRPVTLMGTASFTLINRHRIVHFASMRVSFYLCRVRYLLRRTLIFSLEWIAVPAGEY